MKLIRWPAVKSWKAPMCHRHDPFCLCAHHNIANLFCSSHLLYPHMWPTLWQGVCFLRFFISVFWSFKKDFWVNFCFFFFKFFFFLSTTTVLFLNWYTSTTWITRWYSRYHEFIFGVNNIPKISQVPYLLLLKLKCVLVMFGGLFFVI